MDNERKDFYMKTIKWLKKSIILQIIYFFCCFASSLCFALSHYFKIDFCLGLGILFMYGWCIGLITVIRGFSLFFSERKNERDRKIIGKRWLWFLAFFLVDTLLFWVAGGLMVHFTGGV